MELDIKKNRNGPNGVIEAAAQVVQPNRVTLHRGRTITRGKMTIITSTAATAAALCA
jgi:hypothetical protein